MWAETSRLGPVRPISTSSQPTQHINGSVALYLLYGRTESQWLLHVHTKKNMTIRPSTGAPTTRLDTKQVIEELGHEPTMKRLVLPGGPLFPHEHPFLRSLGRRIQGRGLDEEGEDGPAPYRGVAKDMNIRAGQQPVESSVYPEGLLGVDQIVPHVFFHPEGQCCSDLLNDCWCSCVFSLLDVLVVEGVLFNNIKLLC